MSRPRQVSDEQILAAMRKHVLAEGPSVPLDNVARSLKVSVPAVLKRFGSRQALMLAALRPEDDPAWVKSVQAGPDERPLQAQLLDMFTQISDFMELALPCLSALRESGIPPSQIFTNMDGPLRGLKAIQRWLSLARKRGLVTAPEVDTAAFAIIGSLQTRAFFSHMMKMKFSERDRRQYIQELAQLFARSLNP
jgi:AcrR family transcriptional regulator